MSAIVPVVSPEISRAVARRIAHSAIRGGLRYVAGNPRSFTQGLIRTARFGRQVGRFMSSLRQSRQARAATGVPPGQSDSKKVEIAAGAPQLHNNWQQYQITLNAIARNEGPVSAGQARIDIDTRLRGIAFISGFKIRVHFRNELTDQDLTINWAVIKPKSPSVAITDGFFRAFGTSRDVNFNTSGLTSVEIGNLPISTDKYWVYKRGRFTLGARDASVFVQGNRTKKCSKFLTRYIKLKKQIRYNDDSNQDPEDEIFFVHWSTVHFQTPVVQSPDVYRTQTHIVTYFRDPLH